MSNIIGIFISLLFVGIIIVSAKIFEKFGKEATRKYIHIMLSNWWIIAMIFFDNMWYAATVPAIFVVVNYISYKTNLIKIMEREDGEQKESLGTVYYAISLLILALITFGPINNPLIGLCGIFVMGYGDGLAAVIGKAIKSKEYSIRNSKKTIAGSATMFIVTLIIMTGFFYYVNTSLWLLKSIVVAIIMTAVEAACPKGTDNLSVPLATSLLALLFI